MKFIMFIPVGFLKMKPVINDFQKLIDKIFFNDIFIKTQNYIKIIHQNQYILDCCKNTTHYARLGKFPVPTGPFSLYIFHASLSCKRVPLRTAKLSHVYVKTKNILNKKLNFKETIKVKSLIKTILTFISEEDLLHQISCTELSLL